MVREVLSVDVQELVVVEQDGCWTTEGLIHVAGCSCFTEEVFRQRQLLEIELAFSQLLQSTNTIFFVFKEVRS